MDILTKKVSRDKLTLLAGANHLIRRGNMTLKQVPCGAEVKVLKLNGKGAMRRRIMDMGLTRGARVCMRKVAPLGDPIEVSVRGYSLSIRKEDAANIIVE